MRSLAQQGPFQKLSVGYTVKGSGNKCCVVVSYRYDCAVRRLNCVVPVIKSLGLLAQAAAPRPTFESFPAGQIYQGVPALPKLTEDQRTFRTMIRRGAKTQVKFAGHFTVPAWGCGTECNDFAIVDSINGKVYDGFVITELPGAWEEKQSGDPLQRMEFHPNSRLLKINGCPNETNCGFYDYLMIDGEGLKLIRKELLPKEFNSERQDARVPHSSPVLA